VPSTNAETITDLQAAGLNPNGNQAVVGGQMIQLLLNVQGVSPDIDGLVAAITTFYGGATKVTADEDMVARGIVRLRVVA
jgi:hypothetical protein